MRNDDAFSVLYDTVKRSYERTGRPDRILTALSGGADSVALLILLCALRNEKHFALEAVHVHHGLRAASDAEEETVGKLCEKLDVPLRVCHIHVNSGNVESMAREARYDAFFRICEEDGFRVIALAHHAADRAETFLMRSVRGCGEGLGSLNEATVRDNGIMLWRPLLGALPGQLRALNREKEIDWCEDESNADTRYVRNFLRNEVFPLLEKKVTGSIKGMARSAEIIGDEQDYMREEAKKYLLLYSAETPVPSFDAVRLRQIHPAMQRHIVRQFFERMTGELSFETVEAIRGMRNGDKVNLPRGHYAFCTRDRVYAVAPERPKHVQGSLIETPFTGDTGDGVRRQSCPRESIEKTELRYRQNGDYIYPLGTNGKKSLGDYMTDKKIPLPLRDHVPLLCSGHEVLWVIGYGVSEKLRIEKDKDCVMLNYCPDE